MVKGENNVMSKKKKRVGFIKPIKSDYNALDCIWYGFKAFVSGALAVISIPLTYLGVLSSLLVWLAIIGIIAGGVVYKKVYPDLQHCREVAYDTLAKMGKEDFRLLTDTEVYDSAGNLVGLINSGHFEYAKINDISLKIQNGYIAVEDKRFKTHPGYDWVSIVRAGLALVKHNGEITQGASTITQQVIKNTYLTQEQTFTRKITEILLAPEVEKKFSKADIMEFYCNTNYYGHRCYGVEAASNYYFGKSAKDVEWWEAALLISISNSPSAYDPVKNPEAALQKRNSTLEKICEAGYFDKSLLWEYKSKQLNIVQEYAEGTLENYQTSYAIHCAALELMKNDGFKFQYTFKTKDEYTGYKESYDTAYNEKSEQIRSGGYKIYTTLDSSIQASAQEILDSSLSRYTEKQESGKYALQGAAVVVDNRTNQVVAVIGGRGADDLFNRGYLAVRQPGSSIKPIIDYAPAFDTGEYYPSKIMNDHQWEGGPKNSGSYRGLVTIREALNRSLNTVAWQVLQGIGIEKGLSYLGNMKFMTLTDVDTYAEAVSIGGFTRGTRVVDMAKAYSTLANEGIYNDKTCIKSIVHERDGELFKTEPEEVQVYQTDTAYMVTDILKGTMDKEYATGYGLDIPGQEAAGKTGTTNSNKDTWFCGYTRYYSTAVWVGYDTPREMPGVFGATYAGRIWKQIMQGLHQGLESWDWERPETVVDGFYNPGDGSRIAENVGFVDLFSTTAEVRAEESRLQRERDNFNKAIEEKLKEFERFHISGVEDTYLIDEEYLKAMEQISLVIDDEARVEFSDRASKKYQDLIHTRDKMKDAIEKYEQDLEEAEKEEEESIAEEEERKREEETKRLRIKAFEDKLWLVTNMKYQQSNANKLVTDAAKELEKLVDLDEYDSLYRRLNTAKENIKNLPTKTQWDIMESERIAREEAAKLAEEKRKQEEEAARLAELQKMQQNLNETQAPVVETQPPVVETQTVEPSTSAREYGPGFNNP